MRPLARRAVVRRRRGRGDERVAQRAWPDRFVRGGAAGDPTHGPAGAVPIHPLPVRSEEDRPVQPFADGQVDRSGRPGGGWDDDDLAALAGLLGLKVSRGVVAVLQFELDGADVGEG
jgi:hypothetical protein